MPQTRRSAIIGCVEPLEPRRLLTLLAHGVDPSNLGKGSWIWQVNAAMSNVGATTVQGLIDYEKAKGMGWIIVKAGDGNDGPINNYGDGSGSATQGSWGQYNADIITRAHAAGFKIFPYVYPYGGADPSPKTANTDVPHEIQVALDAMSLGGDGLVIDAEGQYERVPTSPYGGPAGAATTYMQAIRGSFPNTFIAHAPLPYISLHQAFPYKEFGRYCDAVMPQDYWDAIGTCPSGSRSPTIGKTLTATRMVADMEAEWKYAQNQWISLGWADAVKPIIPLGQGYQSGGTHSPTTGTEITEFYNALKGSSNPATTGGYKGISFWSAQHHSADIWSAIGSNSIGDPPAAPASPSPANGAVGVSAFGLTLDWADASKATNYDVYFDGALVANVTQSQWTVTPQTTGGAHNWQVISKNMAGSVNGATWSMLITPAAPGAPSNPNPAHNSLINVPPTKLDWADTPGATEYDVYLGADTSPRATVTVSEFGLGVPGDGTRNWRIVARNPDGTTSGPQWTYFLDTQAPTAALGAQTPAAPQTTFDFTVTYADAVAGVDASTIGAGDVTVTGPNNFNQLAQFIGVDVNTNGSPRVATYRITATGGTFDAADDGVYTVAQNANQIRDVAANVRAAGTIGSFTVVAFAYLANGTLNVQFNGSATPVSAAPSGSNITVTQSGRALSYAAGAVNDMLFTGTPGDDPLEWNSLSKPFTFNAGAGNDSLTIKSGSYTFDSDVVAMSPHLTLKVAAGASALFNSSQHAENLQIDGAATLAAGGNKVIVTQTLAVAGQLNLKDNDLIVDYTGASPLGSWNGSSYSGVTGLIASGIADGNWNGNGLVTDMPQALNLLTTLAVAEASDVRFITGGQTASFDGQTIDSTCVLVKYTYMGDADLNGRVNGDDYFLIDQAYVDGLRGFSHGDFDYNGTVDSTDYFLIDNAYHTQDAPL